MKIYIVVEQGQVSQCGLYGGGYLLSSTKAYTSKETALAMAKDKEIVIDLEVDSEDD